MRKNYGILELILGILLICLGLYTFLEPSAVLSGIAAIYGALALVTGIVDIVFYARMERRLGFGPVVSLVSGILSVIAGLLILFNLSAGAWLMSTLFPLWFLAHCVSRLAQLPLTRLTSGGAAAGQPGAVAAVQRLADRGLSDRAGHGQPVLRPVAAGRAAVKERPWRACAYL